MEGKPAEQEVTAPAAEQPVAEKVAAPAAATADAGALLALITSALPPEEQESMNAAIVAALKTVFDPEIPADIYELGLIYSVDVDAERNVAIAMTLTAPACPVAGEMPKWVENAVNAVPGVNHTTVTMSFNPPWDMSRMSDEARLALNMF